MVRYIRYNICQWLATVWWLSPGTPVSSTNKTDRHDMTEILLKLLDCYNKIPLNLLYNRVSGVMVSELVSISVRVKIKLHTFDMCCFSSNHTTLRRNIIDWSAWNLDNVSKWEHYKNTTERESLVKDIRINVFSEMKSILHHFFVCLFVWFFVFVFLLAF
jgi:hypothetical protein